MILTVMEWTVTVLFRVVINKHCNRVGSQGRWIVSLFVDACILDNQVSALVTFDRCRPYERRVSDNP